MFLIHFDVNVQIFCLKILVSICIHFLVFLCPDYGPIWSRNCLRFIKQIHKIVLFVNGNILDCCIN